MFEIAGNFAIREVKIMGLIITVARKSSFQREKMGTKGKVLKQMDAKGFEVVGNATWV